MSGDGRLDAVVVGGGAFGLALAATLARLGRDVEVWVRRGEHAVELNTRHASGRYLPGVDLPPALAATTDLSLAVRRARVLLFAVPSQSFREVARAVGDYASGEHVLVHSTKGFEAETSKRMSQVLREETCVLKIGVLAGPVRARELIAGQPSGALLASRYDEVLESVQALFRGGPLRVYAGRDVVGAEVAGAFRNVVALAVGVCEGLGFGENAKSLVVTRGLGEMARLGVAMGGETLTFGGLAGIGDIVAACSSGHGRNHEVGRRLAAGEPLEAVLASAEGVAEGVPAVRAVRLYAEAMGLELPIVTALHAMLYEGVPVSEALGRLLATPVGPEFPALSGR